MEFSSRFNKLIKEILKREGGYCDNPSDRGGPTNHGITQKVYNTFRLRNSLKMQTVKKIVLEEVLQIYYKEYYSPLDLDVLQQEASADILFDLAVNSGLSRAKSFEREYGYDPQVLLNRRCSFYLNLCARKPTQEKFLNGWLDRLNIIAKKYGLKPV